MTRQIPALISIHDVMPYTLSRVQGILEGLLVEVPTDHVMLLVVPGLPWSEPQIGVLKSWQQQGFVIAGHGWQHRVRKTTTWFHRLHSALVSRQAAEHLSLSEDELVRLMTANYQWFIRHDFKAPHFYVPPAWAMGSISRQALRRLPFSGYETTTGWISNTTGRRRRLPLLGFEADTAVRAFCLWLWNRVNRRLARKNRPVRVAIHPFDDEFRLARQLVATLTQVESLAWGDYWRGNKSICTIEDGSHKYG
ncbi:polysaccharide deacetylase family protein [Reinekea sp. G2M2-21]|uniref:polysaccharide deacetylase family protein n=1 Tax=Reinekea sp. G2M2-21 TaxID=2788942 RepID=UPI0018AA3E08|nr:polysaccharide deacetylase family protein [Reinekea sp. G2M2-21]